LRDDAAGRRRVARGRDPRVDGRGAAGRRPRRAGPARMTFVHHVRPRYAEVDLQGVVFNAHWLTYFDEASTRFFEHLGFAPSVAFFRDFDVMVVKAVLEWQGPAGFDDDVAIEVFPS